MLTRHARTAVESSGGPGPPARRAGEGRGRRGRGARLRGGARARALVLREPSQASRAPAHRAGPLRRRRAQRPAPGGPRRPAHGAARGADQHLVRTPHRFRAMGCEVVVAGATARERSAIEALFAARDATFSRFRDGSELCRVNRSAAPAVLVSAPFARAVEAALAAARQTDGLVDPTLLDALEHA